MITYEFFLGTPAARTLEIKCRIMISIREREFRPGQQFSLAALSLEKVPWMSLKE